MRTANLVLVYISEYMFKKPLSTLDVTEDTSPSVLTPRGLRDRKSAISAEATG